MGWIDRYSGNSYRITTSDSGLAGRVRVRSYRDVLEEYRHHLEPKSLGPDGSPCARQTRGMLSRRQVAPLGKIVRVGRESNQLEAVQVGLVSDRDVVQEYNGTDSDNIWRDVVIPTVRQLPRAVVARKLVASKRTVSAFWKGRR